MLNASQGLSVKQGLTLTSGNITFPNTYSTAFGSNHLGYYSVSYNNAASPQLTNNVWYKIRTLIISPGVYLASSLVVITAAVNSDYKYYSTVISNNDTSIDNDAYNYATTYNTINYGFNQNQLHCYRIISTTSTITLSLWAVCGFNTIANPPSIYTAFMGTHLKVVRLA